MALIDTTNVVDSSMYLRAKLKNNMVGDNYYIENLQEKRNADWEFRYNVVQIEEESKRQINYTPELPGYLPLEVVIRNVKNDRGQDLGMDWADISFKDLKYPSTLGQRYRFQLDFPNMEEMTTEEKYYETSVWITVNKSPINPGNSAILRRCNTSIALVGSPTRDYHNITQMRYEPGILETDLRYMNMYYNQTLVVPQAEWYLTLQMNYFTNCIKLNNRLILGGTDTGDPENNSVFVVKAVVKSASSKTFAKAGDTGIEDIPLIVLALDKGDGDSQDDYINRIPVNAPMYFVPDQEPIDEYYVNTGVYGEVLPGGIDGTNDDNGDSEGEDGVEVLTDIDNEPVHTLVMGETERFFPKLMFNGNIIEAKFAQVKWKLNGIKKENWFKYFNIVDNEDGSFSVTNIKSCNRGNLEVTVSWDLFGLQSVHTRTQGKNENGKDELASVTYKFKLGGFY